MRRIMFLFVILCVSVTVPAAQKRAFTLDDLYRLKSISSLEISPDGKELLFVVTSSDLKKAEKNSDIWRMNVNTGNVQQLTFDKGADFSPVWSEDGRFIYFVSTRKGGAQLWKMSSRGGEALKLTDFSTGIANPKPLPDGSEILFESSVFPEAGADSKGNKTLQKQLAEGATQAHFASALLYRHWTTFRDWQYSHLFRFTTSDDSITELTKGEKDFPSYGGNYGISPDGKTVCMTINPDKKKETSTNSDLYL
ncbi:MAG: PD40 domain-containing protein, partial [Holophagae bacterium]|nr:PD40 domain-containing protein [Holophagae bacterium]